MYLSLLFLHERSFLSPPALKAMTACELRSAAHEDADPNAALNFSSQATGLQSAAFDQGEQQGVQKVIAHRLSWAWTQLKVVPGALIWVTNLLGRQLFNV